MKICDIKLEVAQKIASCWGTWDCELESNVRNLDVCLGELHRVFEYIRNQHTQFYLVRTKYHQTDPGQHGAWIGKVSPAPKVRGYICESGVNEKHNKTAATTSEPMNIRNERKHNHRYDEKSSYITITNGAIWKVDYVPTTQKGINDVWFDFMSSIKYRGLDKIALDQESENWSTNAKLWVLECSGGKNRIVRDGFRFRLRNTPNGMNHELHLEMQNIGLWLFCEIWDTTN